MTPQDLQAVKLRFGIIGNTAALNRAIEMAVQVAPIDMPVLVTGESGSGKEFFPQIIHQYSARKHGPYHPINCAAIAEGTLDSELFGHEKGAFTGAIAERKGYFEVADGGTLFLDEVGELPLATQARLLRVLETGEFIRVGSSKVIKTDVRVVAATNVDLVDAVRHGRFRQDLYYRLNGLSIYVPPLRERPDDIPRLFRRFASEMSERYKMPSVTLTESAKEALVNYRWPGNIREMKNLAERITVLEAGRELTADTLKQYFEYASDRMPVLYREPSGIGNDSFANERELLYKVLFEMRRDMNDLKSLVNHLMQNASETMESAQTDWRTAFGFDSGEPSDQGGRVHPSSIQSPAVDKSRKKESATIQDASEYVEESLSLEDMEKEAIRRALERNNGRRKNAAADLNISERTLYRKIKEYHLE